MPSLALPTVAELFKGTFDESLKKLVQPSAIIPAAVLVLLNIVLVYPQLLDQGWAIAEGFNDLEDIWKAVLLAVAVLMLGYIILNLSRSILRLATGKSWLDSTLGHWMVGRHQARRRELAQAGDQADAAGQHVIAARLRAKSEALPLPDYTSPTAMGNVLNGMSEGIYARYGIDVSALWPHLAAVLAEDETPILAQIDEEASAFSVLLNLAAVLALGSLEAVLISLVFGNWIGAAFALGLLPLAYLLYRASITRVSAYADEVEAAFDLYRPNLAKALSLELPNGLDEAKAAWEAQSQYVLFNALSAGEKIAAKSDPASDVTVKASANLQTSVVAAEVSPVDNRNGPRDMSSLSRTWRFSYLVLVTSTSRSSGDGFAAILDKRVPVAPHDIDSEWINAIEGGGHPIGPIPNLGAGVLWRLSGLTSNAGAALSYRVEVGELIVRASEPGLVLKAIDADAPKQNVTMLRISRRWGGLEPEDLGALGLALAGTRFDAGDEVRAAHQADDGLPMKIASATVSDAGDLLLELRQVRLPMTVTIVSGQQS